MKNLFRCFSAHYKLVNYTENPEGYDCLHSKTSISVQRRYHKLLTPVYDVINTDNESSKTKEWSHCGKCIIGFGAFNLILILLL